MLVIRRIHWKNQRQIESSFKGFFWKAAKKTLKSNRIPAQRISLKRLLHPFPNIPIFLAYYRFNTACTYPILMTTFASVRCSSNLVPNSPSAVLRPNQPTLLPIRITSFPTLWDFLQRLTIAIEWVFRPTSNFGRKR